MAEDGITPEIQAQVQQFQALSTQLQQLTGQKQQMEAMKGETDQALAALQDAPDDAPVWRAVGPMMMQEKSKAAAMERLQEDSETMEIRIKRVAGQIESTQTEAKELQAKLQAAFGQ